VAEGTTIAELKRTLNSKFPKFSPSRQRYTTETGNRALEDDHRLTQADFTTTSDSILLVKDLGPQVAWRTVFLTEYAGPLIIHPLAYYLPNIFYGRSFEHSYMQKVAFVLVILHFLKREFETLFVHRFSHGTMPLFNIFKNSAHYHILSGVFLAGSLYGPWYSATSKMGSARSNPGTLYPFLALWAFAELSNLHVHITLKNLRPPGTRVRGIPKGFLFNYVSCPNYFTEILAWLAFLGITIDWAALLFLTVSIVQMVLWAVKKHKAYKKEFGSKYPRRKVIFPFVF
jgi:very-long-chain enoyl-CoA reductase